MGGNALKNTFTRRYQRDEFVALEKRMVETLSKTFKNVHPTTYFKSKETFGDMDVLIMNDGINFNIKEYIQETFNPNEIFVNSAVYSFDYEELQIDLIFIPTSNWESAKTYYSFNDLHNFVGKVAHQFGLKWGVDGLKWVGYNESRNKTGTVYLTKDYRKALDFLGFDVERYEQGFESLEEIFEFVRNCKYYNPYYFDFELMNRVNRERDSKRSTYAGFIDYIESDKEHSDKDGHQFFKDKSMYLGHINLHFPIFYNEYMKIQEKAMLAAKCKEKYNGRLVMDYMKNEHNIELTGKALGDAMNNFEEKLGGSLALKEYVLATPQHEIMNKFYQLFNK